LFFNFAVLFAFGCCSLAQKLIFVDHYLPYFRQWLITHPLLALLPFQPLFTESIAEMGSFPFPPSLVRLQHPTLTVCSFSVPCLLFSFFFLQGGASFCPGGFAGL
jgi:hypothetical protein